MRNIAYKDYKKSSDIHGTVLYPAVMVAPVQNDLLADLIEQNKVIDIIDPFHGSGTALYEAAKISSSVNLYGSDINPLANLITTVKLQGVDFSVIEENIALLDKYLHSDTDIAEHTFYNIEKWFKPNIIKSLSKIRNAIIQIENDKNRLFFWYCMSDIIRKHSNTRSCTYKLYSKTESDISKINDTSIKDFLDKVRRDYPRFVPLPNKLCLYKGDCLDYLHSKNNATFDICITSPPYGDNATTVTYGQFSMLPLIWIGEKDLALEGWEFKNYSIIDSKSLGGCENQADVTDTNLVFVNWYLSRISEDKRRKVTRFFNGYFEFLKEICRTTKKFIILTLGDRTVSGVKINLTKITERVLGQLGFELTERAHREIASKRTPQVLAYQKDGTAIKSMTIETVLVFERKDYRL